MPSIKQHIQTVSLALEQAIDFHAGGDPQRAQEIYRTVLADDPSNAVALHYLGIYLFQAGDHEKGLAHIRLSCELEPENSGWQNDLGNVLFALERFELAMESYQGALQLSPRDPDIWNNLGSAHLKLGDQDTAIIAFRQAIEIAPEFSPALENLGAVYEARGNKFESSVYQCRAFVLPTHEGKSKQMLGICFYFLGRLQEAAEIYQSWLEDEPNHPIATHMYAACSQSDVPKRASNEYLEEHFDHLAKNFDVNLLQNLDYGGPLLISQAMAEITKPARQYNILDIGCGTGLCAPHLAPYAWYLIGVDLSAKMLERAAALHLYDVLEKQEITHYLAVCPDTFDIVAACDTLIYFGDLNQLFDGVARVLKPGGYFVFTTESIIRPEESTGYQLHASGRYRHAETYVDRILRKFGFELRFSRLAKIRDEAGTPITGTVVTVQKIQPPHVQASA
ncbi:tetratricopeptide repeat protein [Herbaspirillum rhizosphaerae]|uniref:Tetratricopeptide repeat protein n=1 Tax=Herbaspirillum rhizosphaerae TaxID=346179 RepID=A0ABW8Z3P5_9BURK